MGSSNDSSVESSNDDVVIKEDLITYSKNQLIALKEVSLSTEWPSYLDEGFKNNRGHWDPDRWHQNKRRGSTPPPEEKGGNGTTKDDVSAPGNKASLTSLFLQHSNFQKLEFKLFLKGIIIHFQICELKLGCCTFYIFVGSCYDPGHVIFFNLWFLGNTN